MTELQWKRIEDEKGRRDVAEVLGSSVLEDIKYVVRQEGRVWTLSSTKKGGPRGGFKTMREARAAAQEHADNTAADQLDATSSKLQWIPARSFGRDVWTARALHVKEPVTHGDGLWEIHDVLGLSPFVEKYAGFDGSQSARYAVKGPRILELHSTAPVYVTLVAAMKHAQTVTDDVLNGLRSDDVIANERSSTQVEPEPAECTDACCRPSTPVDNRDAVPAKPLLTPLEAGAHSTEWQKTHLLNDAAEEAKKIRDAERQIHKLVDEARRKGATWAEIGETLGLSLQGAHKRYGTKKPTSSVTDVDVPMF